jgi:hypothetical protein
MKRLWQSWAPLPVKLFLWLACRGRVWTADRRRRRGLDTHIHYPLCDQDDETINHLLITYPVAKEVWWSTCYWVRCTCNLGAAVTIQDWWEQLLLMQGAGRRDGVSTLFMLVCWQLWKERNARVFDRRSATVAMVLDRIRAEADLWITAGARKLGSLCCE